jgi:hypothetical protein
VQSAGGARSWSVQDRGHDQPAARPTRAPRGGSTRWTRLRCPWRRLSGPSDLLPRFNARASTSGRSP